MLQVGTNQRLEFLGDAVLQFVVSVYLFRMLPNLHEGHLTVRPFLPLVPPPLFSLLAECLLALFASAAQKHVSQ